MQCPACNNVLAGETVMNVELDHCLACGGYWFDADEMGTLIPLLSSMDQVENFDIHEIHTEPEVVGKSTEKCCPRCHCVMREYNYCYDSNIMLDRCESCAGIWLDDKELLEIIQYVKGNPKLDKLSVALAKHVAVEEARKDNPFISHRVSKYLDSDLHIIFTAIYDYIMRFRI